MNLLDLAKELGLDPHKTSASHGGEYHCPCPSCGGNDRFMFWPEDDRYWCRQCNSKGDAIQFCRDFHGLSFQAACMKAQKDSANLDSQSRFKPADTSSIREPSGSWKDKARHFSDTAHQRLLIDKTAMGLIVQRGLSSNSIQQYQLGWNPIKAFHRRSDWGLEETENRKWICLPAGIVIPIFENSQIQKIKIRKSEWKEGDFYGKYYEVPGSSNMIPIFGDPSMDICIVVEAEFDAMLVIQEAGDLCNCIALGGAQKRPQSLHPAMACSTETCFYSLWISMMLVKKNIPIGMSHIRTWSLGQFQKKKAPKIILKRWENKGLDLIRHSCMAEIMKPSDWAFKCPTIDLRDRLVGNYGQ